MKSVVHGFLLRTKSVHLTTLSIRTHICPECGFVGDRDWNAAKNILKLALEQGFGENTALAGFMTREATYIVGGSSLAGLAGLFSCLCA